jgi:hypothetical protein
MADASKLTMDKAGLKSFVDNRMVPFQDDLDKVANKGNEDDGVTMDDLLGNGATPDGEKEIFTLQRPLAIGQLASETKYANGDKIITAINDAAQSVSDVYVKQIKLFKDLHDNLETTITKLMDGQNDNLGKIDGKGFLDGLGTVPGDFQGTGGGSGQS